MEKLLQVPVSYVLIATDEANYPRTRKKSVSADRQAGRNWDQLDCKLIFVGFHGLTPSAG
jgi:hypothetical protein